MFGADRLGTRVVLGNREKEEIRIWRQEFPQNPTLIEERAPVVDAAISLDGRWLFSAVEDQSLPAGSGRAARVWDLASGELAKQFDGNIGFAGVGRFSSDGKWLAIIGETNQVVSTSTWQPPAPTPNDLIEMSFSHSGQFLAGPLGRESLSIHSQKSLSCAPSMRHMISRMIFIKLLLVPMTQSWPFFPITAPSIC